MTVAVPRKGHTVSRMGHVVVRDTEENPPTVHRDYWNAPAFAPDIAPIDTFAYPDIEDAPVLTALLPDTAVAGDPTDIDMIVQGTGFTPKSVIVFGGLDEPTTFNSDTEVTTGVKPSLFVNPDVVQVGVRNGSAASNALDFTFTDAGTRSKAKK